MKTRNKPSERSLIAAAIGRWENEGGATSRDSMDHHYGRRIEADRSWTVYHVFTGVPAHVEGDAMTGLSRLEATSGMLSLNLRNIERRNERIKLRSFAGQFPETMECRS
jgi:hypothetical protein